MATPAEPEGLAFDPRELLKMLFRRRWWLIVAIVTGVTAAAAFVALQKPMYRSSATLLIDSQTIPTSLVASPLTGIADERISKISQQIMSRESLTAIIRAHNLYPLEQQALEFDQVLNVMRGAIEVNQLPASGAQGDTGRTIAFTVSFIYENPAAAQAVTRTLSELFLQEDMRFRTEQATGTTAFLTRGAEELRRQLIELEEERRMIEARYAGALPHQIGLTAQAEGSLRAEISRIDTESQSLMQQNSLLAAREQELARAPRPESESLRRAEERLRELNAIYADDFPEVQTARATVERHRQALRSLPQEESLLQREIAAGRARLELLASRRAQVVAEMNAVETRTSLAPQASYELTVVEREYDNLRRQYEDRREKQLEAEVTANLQTEGKGEHFTIVNEPSLPHSPDGPKPAILIFLGLVAGAGAGAVITLGYELLGGTIHGEATLTRLFGAAPIGVVPVEYPAGWTLFGVPIPPLLRWRRGAAYERSQHAT
jgi:uncharacterized protein involved in exopolysaccharide biosynthesis